MANLKRKHIRFLRKIQKFLIEEPRRFSMKYGITNSDSTLLEQPPCGTACCIAGAAYVVATQIKLNHTELDWTDLMKGISHEMGIDFDYRSIFGKLFFLKSLHPGTTLQYWPDFYEQMYIQSRTPLQRACVGVARIEHFIATDGKE